MGFLRGSGDITSHKLLYSETSRSYGWQRDLAHLAVVLHKKNREHDSALSADAVEKQARPVATHYGVNCTAYDKLPRKHGSWCQRSCCGRYQGTSASPTLSTLNIMRDDSSVHAFPLLTVGTMWTMFISIYKVFFCFSRRTLVEFRFCQKLETEKHVLQLGYRCAYNRIG